MKTTSSQNGWKSVRLRDICNPINYGYTASASRNPVGPKFLRITDIVPNLIDWSSVPYCEMEGKNFDRYRLKEGDIVVARTGATTGYAKQIRKPVEAVFASYLVRFRPNNNGVCQRYIGIVVESDDYKRFIKTNLGGAAQPQANAQILGSYPLMLPPLDVQQKIAAILSAYEDLIENNVCRIKVLEEMARAIYREWFVNFRFPGHEKVKVTRSENGYIPEGWKPTTLGEVAENFDRMRKPLSQMQRAGRKGPYPYYGAARIFDYIDDYIFDGDFLLVAEDGSVITPDRKPVLQLAHGKFWANNHTHIIRGRLPVSTEFLYLVLQDLDISGYVTGAAQPKVTQANLNRMPVLKPTAGLLNEFNELSSGVFAEVNVLERKNANLLRTRDLLLSKFISGELDVSDLDIDTSNLDQ